MSTSLLEILIGLADSVRPFVAAPLTAEAPSWSLWAAFSERPFVACCMLEILVLFRGGGEIPPSLESSLEARMATACTWHPDNPKLSRVQQKLVCFQFAKSREPHLRNDAYERHKAISSKAKQSKSKLRSLVVYLSPKNTGYYFNDLQWREIFYHPKIRSHPSSSSLFLLSSLSLSNQLRSAVSSVHCYDWKGSMCSIESQL